MVIEQENAPTRKRRILVVDDHEDNIEVLRARLEARGYEVEGATNGQAALDTVGHWCPDLILLDVMMPDMDGLEVVKRLKADRNLPFIPVIMQTALDSTERMVAGLEAGADDYVTKPINFAELEARVRSLLRIKKLQQELGDREKERSQMNDRLLHISMTDGLTSRAASARNVRALPAASRTNLMRDVGHRSLQEGERYIRPCGG
jgi:DNA-binding response OmpR family regulator